MEKGNLILGNDNARSQIDALYFRHLQGVGLLVGLNSQGIMELPDDLPPVWIVSPTREKGRLGFCINGNFEVDAGRARLAGESGKNKEEAKKIGLGVGNMLCSLFQNSLEDWPIVRAQLGLLPDLSHYKFWESVWNTLTKSWIEPSEKQLDSEVSDVVSNLLGGNSGLGRLIKEKYALPNGLLITEFRRLINPNAIFYVLKPNIYNRNNAPCDKFLFCERSLILKRDPRNFLSLMERFKKKVSLITLENNSKASLSVCRSLIDSSNNPDSKAGLSKVKSE